LKWRFFGFYGGWQFGKSSLAPLSQRWEEELLLSKGKKESGVQQQNFCLLSFLASGKNHLLQNRHFFFFIHPFPPGKIVRNKMEFVRDKENKFRGNKIEENGRRNSNWNSMK
jgi:hypothetical protein